MVQREVFVLFIQGKVFPEQLEACFPFLQRRTVGKKEVEFDLTEVGELLI